MPCHAPCLLAPPPLQVRKVYAQKRQVEERSFQMLYDDHRIADHETPGGVSEVLWPLGGGGEGPLQVC